MATENFVVLKKQQDKVEMEGKESKTKKTILFVTFQKFGIAGGDIHEGDIYLVDDDISMGGIVHIKKIDDVPENPIKDDGFPIVNPPKTDKYTATIIKVGVNKNNKKYAQYNDFDGTLVWINEPDVLELPELRVGDTIEVEDKKNERGIRVRVEKIKLLPSQTPEGETSSTEQKPPSKALVKRQVTDKIFNTGGTYRIGSKTIADAGKTQENANKARISTKTREIRVDEIPDADFKKMFMIDNVRVIVTAVSEIDGVFQDASCELELKIEVFLRFLEKKNKCKDEGREEPKLEDFIGEVFKIRSFLTRVAESKAQERAQKKMLNQEFRSDEEIESEDRDVRMVG